MKYDPVKKIMTNDYSIEERIEMNIKEIRSRAAHLKGYNSDNITKGQLPNIMYHTRLLKQACENIVGIVTQEVK